MTSMGLINYLKSTIFGSSTIATPSEVMDNKLETDAGRFKNGVQVDEETILLEMEVKMNQNRTAINNISELDLDDMEKDLALYEKVETLFLKYKKKTIFKFVLGVVTISIVWISKSYVRNAKMECWA